MALQSHRASVDPGSVAGTKWGNMLFSLRKGELSFADRV